MAGPPYTDPCDDRLVNPEWDMVFGLMVGRLVAMGYTPAQIQAKVRALADMTRDAIRTHEGSAATEAIQDGFADLMDAAGFPPPQDDPDPDST